MNTRLLCIVKRDLGELSSASKSIKALALVVFLIGMHSLVLGGSIYFFTESFYSLFFHARIENLFFVRQSGLFLFCTGMFYFCPLFDLKERHRMVMVIILIKVLAVLFLITNARSSASPPIILLAAAGDGCMALLLAFFYYRTDIHSDAPLLNS
ncbi:MAG: hypothetical protein WCP20_04880 [Desulfuromonadales bacterium]